MNVMYFSCNFVRFLKLMSGVVGATSLAKAVAYIMFRRAMQALQSGSVIFEEYIKLIFSSLLLRAG